MSTRVTYGAESEEGNLAGKTVTEIRQLYENVFNIAPDAVALVNGKQMGEDYVVQDGDKVEFSKAHVKGLVVC